MTWLICDRSQGKEHLVEDINKDITRALVLRSGKGEEIPGSRNCLSKDVEVSHLENVYTTGIFGAHNTLKNEQKGE